MNNNDILRRIRYAFSLNDDRMTEIFNLGGLDTTREQISAWLKKEEDPALREIYDKQLAAFLNGLIITKRGRKDGAQPKNESKLNNNMVFRKLKIALDLKAEDILSILDLSEMHISKHELSAFFRNPDQDQYRPCKDQILRNFLYGLQKKYHNNDCREYLL
jgi:uncharacterized protein YehS (DUF1456 family)